jgi:transcriptional regulator with XRE-family HTH domain
MVRRGEGVSRTQQSTGRSAGVLLRQWRGIRGKSQLALAMEAGVSQRHVSFVESGRSVPSRQMLLDLAEALDVPLRERNTLLVAAGYAPVYAEDPLDGRVMERINVALQRMLRQHEPYPALVLDRTWSVLRTNDAAARFFGSFIDLASRPKPRNLLHLMFDPAGLRPFVANWAETAKALLARVNREALGGVVDPQTRRLLDELSRYPGVEAAWRAPTPASALPMIPLSFIKDGVTLSYFSMLATVGTPQTIAAQELRLECMFPADAATEEAHAGFVLAHAAAPSATQH